MATDIRERHPLRILVGRVEFSGEPALARWVALVFRFGIRPSPRGRRGWTGNGGHRFSG